MFNNTPTAMSLSDYVKAYEQRIAQTKKLTWEALVAGAKVSPECAFTRNSHLNIRRLCHSACLSRWLTKGCTNYGVAQHKHDACRKKASDHTVSRWNMSRSVIAHGIKMKPSRQLCTPLIVSDFLVSVDTVYFSLSWTVTHRYTALIPQRGASLQRLHNLLS